MRDVTLEKERQRSWINKGFAYVEFEAADDVDNAVKHMNGGQVGPLFFFFLPLASCSERQLLIDLVNC